MNLVYLLLFLCILKQSIAHEDVTVKFSTCRNSYTMEDITEAYVTYRGGHIGEECYIKFVNWDSFQKDLCVKPVKMKLGCTTKMEYFRHFISEYLEPERRFTCANKSNDEWCGGKRTSYFFMVFKNSDGAYDSDTVLHVYLKDFPKKEDILSSSSSSTVIIVPLVTALIVAVIVVVLIVVIVKVLQRNRALRLPYRGPIPMHTGTTQLQPQYLPQQQQPETTQGDYQWHPMQSAYPVPSHDTANPLITEQQTPSAPTLDYTTPPPPYHSVVK